MKGITNNNNNKGNNLLFNNVNQIMNVKKINTVNSIDKNFQTPGNTSYNNSSNNFEYNKNEKRFKHK